MTDSDEAHKYVCQWNDDVKRGLPYVEFEAVFGVGYGKMGVITDPDDETMCMLFGFYPVTLPNHQYAGPGRGGYAWQCLAKAPLKDDQLTHNWLTERFALRNKQGRLNMIKMYNLFLEG